MMLLLKDMFFNRIRCRNCILFRLTNGKKFRIIKQCFPNQRHVSGAGIMIFIIYSIGVGKIRIHPSEILTCCIHLSDEPVIILIMLCSNSLPHCTCCFIRRCQKCRIQCLLHANLISCLQPDRRIARSKTG